MNPDAADSPAGSSAVKRAEASIEQAAFEAIEKDFQDVLSELVGDRSLEKFRVEYEKLHRALRKSYENEKRLIRRVKELGSEIVSNASKIQTALKLSKRDQTTINSLRSEIEKAWKMVDAAREKEALARETIDQLKGEVDSLSKLVEQGAGISMGEESTVKELIAAKEKLLSERNTQVEEITELRSQTAELLERIRSLETQKLNLDHQLRTLRDMLTARKTEAARERRKRDRTEKELIELRQSVASADDRNQELERRLAGQAEERKKLAKEIREQNKVIVSTERVVKREQERVVKLQADINEQARKNGLLSTAIVDRDKDLTQKEEEIVRARRELEDARRRQRQLQGDFSKLEAQKASLKQELDLRAAEIGELRRQVTHHVQNEGKDKRAIEGLHREQAILTRSLQREQNETIEKARAIKEEGDKLHSAEQELTIFKVEAMKQRKIIDKLEKEREKYGQDAAAAHHKFLQAQMEISTRDGVITDLQKRITEAEARLKQQHNLYEAVRADRNLYSKNLTQAQNEIAEMNRKYHITSRVIEQLKEEIRSKNEALVQEHLNRRQITKEKDSLSQVVQKNHEHRTKLEKLLATQDAEIAKLNHIIAESDTERQQKMQEYQIILGERDILGTQLIRRNDELALLYEKIRIQQATLAKGERQYTERLQDIRLLKLEAADLKRSLTAMKRIKSRARALEEKEVRLEKELLAERTRARALSDELQNPLNVHRWRQLEGFDPGTYDLLRKVQLLQKRLIGKTEEVAEKELLIEEKEGLVLQLKRVLARQPGPEVVEQVSVLQKSLKDKARQMKSLSAELAMHKAQVSDYKDTLGRLAAELTDAKKRYFALKRKEHAAYRQAEAAELQRRREEGTEFPLQANNLGARFVGGGFSLDRTGVPDRLADEV
eukprot:gnl/Chilomastix_cuspidata/1720.p1 GENE.gnl/Chilomastix_cuspidata/1720~~gnl/Chilomastix_cuspidata/1720.p1  ORF type:complete len:898 (+),score=562.81 gnl/Chilomastix_cuspidata/1720:75-2768(+)